MPTARCFQTTRSGDGNRHYCGHDTHHRGPHRCRCGARWSEWYGGNTLVRRYDIDGTRWEIRRNPAPRAGIDRRFILTCRYRDITLRSPHANIDAAKAHADDMTNAWKSRTMREYRGAS